MGQILSQEEVDALLKGVAGGDVETESGRASRTGQERVEKYDFSSQEKVVRGRMPTLDVINDRFARFFRNALSNMLRRMVDITPVSLDTLKFGNFMRSLPVPTSIHIVRVEPLRGNALVVVEAGLAFALIDCFFGGRGKAGVKVEGREFTPIEQRILYKVVNAVMKEWANAWKPVYELHFSYVRGEMNPQFAGIIPNEDLFIVIQFEVEMDETSGNVMLCLPYMLIEPIRDRLYASFQTEDKGEIDASWLERFKDELMGVNLDISVELGNTSITGRELTSLKPGDVMVLDKDIDGLLMVKVQGVPKFYARPGKVRETMAVEVEGIIEKPLY